MENSNLTEHEKITNILKEKITRSVERLEKGETVHVSGGYLTSNFEDKILDKHHQKIVNKLVSLGYEYTTNHGYGCKDYTFSKAIEL